MNRKKKEKRTHILQVRMTEKEMEVAEHCAKRKKMTLSRYVRWCLFHKKTEITPGPGQSAFARVSMRDASK